MMIITALHQKFSRPLSNIALKNKLGNHCRMTARLPIRKFSLKGKEYSSRI